MRPFSLEEFKKDASRRIVTRDGREVRILCTDRVSEFPIIALVFDTAQQEEVVVTFQKDGKYAQRGEQPLDLFFAPTKREGWVNVFDNFPKENHDYYCDKIYKTKEDAEKDIKKYDIDNYVTTTKIEWEE